MIRITSDSTCDLGELVKKHGIALMPLKVILDTESFKDGVDIAPKDIFAFVAKTKMLPKTSAPSIEDFVEAAEGRGRGDSFYHFEQSFCFLFLCGDGCERVRRQSARGG